MSNEIYFRVFYWQWNTTHIVRSHEFHTFFYRQIGQTTQQKIGVIVTKGLNESLNILFK